MKKILVISVLLGTALALLVCHAGASLVPMSWGSPVMSSTNSLTAFEKDTSTATDNQAASVAFGTGTDLANSVFGSSSFPTISQTSLQNQVLSSVKFQNEQSNSAFSYPFLSIGGSALPSFAF